MSLTNPFGDLQITDSRRCGRSLTRTAGDLNGPATATVLSPHVGATPSVTSWHLRHLAGFGLVTEADPAEVPGDRRQRWWKAKARGFSVTMGDDAESVMAGRRLSDQLAAEAHQQISHWIAEVGPALPTQWQAGPVSPTPACR